MVPATILTPFAMWQAPDGFALIEAPPRALAGKCIKAGLRREIKDRVTWTPA